MSDATIAGTDKAGSQDAATNKAIREVASKPSTGHVIPPEVVAFLYAHVDHMRAEFFGGQLPEIVLSFDVTDRRTLGHFVIGRNGLGVKWAVNLNLIHLARPVYQVVSTLLHEALHSWEHSWGTPARPPYHSAAFRARCEAMGIPTDERGHDLGVRRGSPFEEYCRRHGVAFPEEKSAAIRAEDLHAAPPPLLPAPPARPSGSRLLKYRCPCGVNVRVAGRAFRATCNRCGGLFRLQE